MKDYVRGARCLPVGVCFIITIDLLLHVSSLALAIPQLQAVVTDSDLERTHLRKEVHDIANTGLEGAATSFTCFISCLR